MEVVLSTSFCVIIFKKTLKNILSIGLSFPLNSNLSRVEKKKTDLKNKRFYSVPSPKRKIRKVKFRRFQEDIN